MSVQARLYVTEIKQVVWQRGARIVKLAAVCRGEHNKVWASATPAATFDMTISNPAAAAMFQQAYDEDKELAVTFDLVEKD